MYKKKILFVVGSFNAGGAEKALVSYFNSIDSNRYDLYVYTANDKGIFRPLVPEYVRFLPPSLQSVALGKRFTELYFFLYHPFLFLKKIKRTCRAIFHKKRLYMIQSIWKQWKKDLPILDMDFDIAVGHLQGIPNYFVIDKVRAKRKILWIHNDYNKMDYTPDFDRYYFEKANAVVTISNICLDSLIDAFPDLKYKFKVLENISDPFFIRKMADEPIKESFFDNDKCKIVSVGRLSSQKNFMMAVECAKLLHERRFNFIWIVIGEGPERKLLEDKIRSYNLQDYFYLIGLRSNPYAYISKADLVAQTSLFEGKSIFLDEAKILKKMIVTTNYDTVYDQIIDHKTGIIVDMDPAPFSNAIIESYGNKEMRRKIESQLNSFEYDNTNLINMYYKVYEG